MVKKSLAIKETGRVVAVSGPVIKIEGLPYVQMGELLRIGKGEAVVFQLGQEFTSALVYQDIVYAFSLEETEGINPGETAERTEKVFQIPAGKELLEKIVDPLGRDIDTKISVKTKEFRDIEKDPPGMMEREQIQTPLETGIKIVDALFPIGRGQRELIIGDRKTGKTTLALDVILNQKDVVCIYTAIGQRKAEVVQIMRTLREQGSLDNTIIVGAFASDSTVLQYLAPFSAMTMAEYFREQGKDVLVVFDDLTKHAWAWRELSLLLNRPPGREAYPGDIFSLHARLLERAAKINKDSGSGSISALPICETKEGDISEYVPTNLISITDGQLYLESDLFQKDVKPAVNIGLSVSRIGSQVQRKWIKEVTQGLKLVLSQHKELKKIVQLETKISDESLKSFKRGELLLEIFKQRKHELIDTLNQGIIYSAVLNGFLDKVDLKDVKRFETNFYEFIDDIHPEIKKEIGRQGWTKATKTKLRGLVREFELME